jgi:hypothetical protein
MAESVFARRQGSRIALCQTDELHPSLAFATTPQDLLLRPISDFAQTLQYRTAVLFLLCSSTCTPVSGMHIPHRFEGFTGTECTHVLLHSRYLVLVQQVVRLTAAIVPFRFLSTWYRYRCP